MHLRTLLTTLAVTLLYMPALGQQREQHMRNNEIGLFADVTVTDDAASQIALYGLQFRHFRNDIYQNNTFGYRVTAGKGTYRPTEGYTTTYGSGSMDSIYHIRIIPKQELYFVGIGLDAQRKFYRSLYLYAAVTATFGYGRATVDSVRDVYTLSANNRYEPLFTSGTRVTTYQGNALWIGLAPVLGVKLALGKRIWIGTEFTSALTITNGPVDTRGTRVTNAELHAGRLNERFWVAYRF